MEPSASPISASVTCFVSPSVQTSCTLPRSATFTRVTTGIALSPPIALESMLLNGDVLASAAVSNPCFTRS